MEDAKSNSRIYLEETSLKLIENYKDVIEKTFDISEKDLLQGEIDDEDEKQKESRLLDALKKRRLALDEVDIILEKIEKIEQRLNPDLDNGNEGQPPLRKSWTKKAAAQVK